MGNIIIDVDITQCVSVPGVALLIVSAVDDGQINRPVQESCYRAATDAMNGWDPSGGAIYYYNPVTATSSWIWSRPVIKQIGRHIFCK